MKKESQSVCRRAAEFYYDYLTEPSGVPQDVRKHIERCGECRAELGRLAEILENPEPAARSVRTEILRCQVPLFEQWVGCTQAKPFLPLLAAGGLVPSVPTPAAAHLAHCSLCRNDLEALKDLSLTAEQALAAARVLSGDGNARLMLAGPCADVLEAISRRGDSEVLTKLSRNPDGTFQIATAQRAADEPKRAAVQRSFGWVRYAAAAVLLIAGLLLWQVRPVRGLDIAEVYQALGQAVNVSVTSYPQGGQNLLLASYALEEQRPLQEIWVSNSLGVHLFIEKERAVLWDLNRQRKLIKTASGIEVVPIEEPAKKLEIPWGLLPFRSPSELPSRYKWKSVRPSDGQRMPNVAVYDLTWTDYSALGRPVERRWRGYLDARSKYPLRIEWWEKLGEGPFEKITSTTIRYPQETEVLARIAAEGFDYRPPVQK
ncbi:MAG TPA: hypothetical protein PK054_04055 [Anaerohalosphaeraceae bacterium]|nr:hypothetical protein [Anaerohalosphaeraceae bacterium]HOL88894.1 hypothetical protein [Anaerohalosphaeraceae bacterium]HPP55736.1 hypothetical protein [Anaerohalosphaeraceae bacterium]